MSLGVESKSAMDVVETAKDQGLPWVEKYRPSTLEDVVSQDNIVQTREMHTINEASLVSHCLTCLPPICFSGTPSKKRAVAASAVLRTTRYW